MVKEALEFGMGEYKVHVMDDHDLKDHGLSGEHLYIHKSLWT